MTRRSATPIDRDTASTAQELIVVLNPYNLDFSEFSGPRAMLEAEGIIPDGTEWPDSSAGRSCSWQAGQFDYWLRRERPPGAKGPRKQFADCDWFTLRQELTHQPSCAEREIARKAQELKDVIYRHSAEGEAERTAQWANYHKAQDDKQFQAFKATIPGLVPTKRGRRAVQKELAA